MTPEEVKLVDDLAAQAGLVVSNVRLTADLEARLDVIARQAAELRASRQRIVAAQDEERRRLERNIHDGAQQHLVALAVKLRLASGLVTRDPEKARTMLGEIGGQIDEALETLRVAGARDLPAAARDRGHRCRARRAGTTSSDLPVHFHADAWAVPARDRGGRLLLRAGGACRTPRSTRARSAIDVRFAERDGALTFEVADDGAGFDPPANGAGTGLQGMRDRLAVLGGDVALDVRARARARRCADGSRWPRRWRRERPARVALAWDRVAFCVRVHRQRLARVGDPRRRGDRDLDGRGGFLRICLFGHGDDVPGRRRARGRRRPENPIGWLLLAIGVAWMLPSGTTRTRCSSTISRSAGGPLGVLQWLWVPAARAARHLHPPAVPRRTPALPRWRWLGWLTAIALTLSSLVVARSTRGSSIRRRPRRRQPVRHPGVAAVHRSLTLVDPR